MKTIEEYKLRAGDVLICRGDSQLSNTILKATKGEYSHTAQIIELNNKLYVFDAQLKGCRPMLLHKWFQKWDYDFRVFRNPTQNSTSYELSNWFMQFSGTEYDVKGFSVGIIKSFLINTKLHIFVSNKTMKEKYRNNGLFWCSELTMKPYVQNPEQYAPHDVYEWLIANKWREIL